MDSRGSLRRIVAAAAAVAALAATFSASGASAAPSELEQSGQLTMTSDAGDYVGQGSSYAYATPANVFFASTRSWSGVNNMVSVTMRTDAASTDYWILEFAAAPGSTLTPGTYSDAVRVVSQGPGQPGLDVWGLSRGCNALGGTFTVSDAVFGPNGYVEKFHATFEQHCEGNPSALRGEVSVSNPPPPPPLTANVTMVSAQLGPHGAVTVRGTIACSRAIDPNRSFIQLVASEPAKAAAITGAAAFAIPSNCSPTPTAWEASVTPTDPKSPFGKGPATISAWAQLGDPFFDMLLFQDPTTTTLSVREN